jgi:hypothetical protein
VTLKKGRNHELLSHHRDAEVALMEYASHSTEQAEK